MKEERGQNELELKLLHELKSPRKRCEKCFKEAFFAPAREPVDP